MIRDHAEGDGGFHLFGEGGAVSSQFRVDVHIGLAAEFLQLAEDGGEDVGGVVARLDREIGKAFCALDDRAGALKAHAGIDVFRGQLAEGAVGLGVVLDEDEVPDFDAEVGVVVDEVAAGDGVALRREIDVEFGARTARTGFAHHPEVVLHVAVDDLDFRITTRRAEKFRPDVVGFLVEISGIALLRSVNRGVETMRGQPPAPDDEFPRPRDRLLFEIVSKRPVPQHLEHRVVVGVVADILEVVVLAARADAFLGVCRARRIVRGFLDAEEIRHERVHPGVCEKQARRLRQQRGGGHDGVLFLTEKIEEALADLGGGHGRGGKLAKAAET